MTVIETTNAPVVVTMCDTCNELVVNPEINHFWDENDMYHMQVICKPCLITTNEGTQNA